MSQWTHVSGCIRVDGIPAMGLTPNIASILGRQSTRDWGGMDRYDAGDANIPSGSEGTLQYEIIAAGDGVVWKTVAVWGDLRDFGAEETPQIDEWFGRVIRLLPLVRAAHLLVEVEYGESYVITADTEHKTVHRVVIGDKATTPAGRASNSEETQ